MLQSHHCHIGVCLWLLSLVHSLLEVVESIQFVAANHLHHTYVVLGTVVVGEQLGSFLIYILAFCRVLIECCGVEKFVKREFRRVGSILLFQLFVAAANGLIVDYHACTAQFWQNAVG